MTPLRSWLKDFMASERRRAKRRSLRSLVAYYWDGSTPVARDVQNVSAEGFYLVTGERWYPGTVITMTLQKRDVPKGEKDRSIEVLARVIRSGGNGVAFAFVLPQGPAHHETIPLSRLADKKSLGRFLRGLKEDETSVSVEFAPLAALVSLLIASVFQFKLENWSAIWSVAAFATAIASWHTSSARRVSVPTGAGSRSTLLANLWPPGSILLRWDTRPLRAGKRAPLCPRFWPNPARGEHDEDAS